MENSLFPSKTSFAFLAWLLIAVTIATSPAVLDTVYRIANSAYRNTTVINTASATTNRDIITAINNPAKSKSIISNRDIQCMAENIYQEASVESYVGKMAVGLVVLNRLSSSRYPNTICSVIYQGSQNVSSTCQFSWTCNFHNPINTNSAAWRQSLAVATELLTKRDSIIDITEGATSYHADYVNPYWAKTLKHVVQIDQHIFYSTK